MPRRISTPCQRTARNPPSSNSALSSPALKTRTAAGGISVPYNVTQVMTASSLVAAFTRPYTFSINSRLLTLELPVQLARPLQMVGHGGGPPLRIVLCDPPQNPFVFPPCVSC